MGIRDFFKVKNEVVEPAPEPSNNSYTLDSEELLRLLGLSSEISNNKLSEITYFTCMRLLSEGLAKLPLKMHQDVEKGTLKVHSHNLLKVLTRPNPYMTASTFWAAVELNKNHFGNSYVYINSDRTGVKNLWIMQSECVEVWMDNAGIFNNEHALWYIYSDPKSGKRYKYRHDEVLHFKTSVSFNGITGLAVKDILDTSIENAQRNTSYLNNYYKNGLMGKAVVQYTGELSTEGATKLANSIENFASGTKNAGRVIPLPVGFQLQPLNISMADAQFLEISKYTALQIAGAFGIKPSMINNYDKGNYANVESQQRDFYVNTLLAILKSYEEEITYKLLTENELTNGYKFKFNVNGILRADSKTQIEALSQGVHAGIYTPNEAREFLDLPAKEHGDDLLTNGTFIKIEDVGKQYGLNSNSKGGDNGGMDEN